MYRIWLSVLGAGYSPVIPGTCGSAVAVGVFLGLALWLKSPVIVGLLILAVAVHGLAVTVAYADRLIAQYGPDPRVIVSDEQCGQALTYVCYLWLGQDFGGTGEILLFTGAGFVLFRLFDILKPPPTRRLERIKGGWGVVLDDVMAGIYANIVLQILWWTGVIKSFPV